MALIELRGIHKSFTIPSERRATVREHLLSFYRRRSFQRLTVLRDVTLNLEAGETLGLMGPNGSGKTTLLKIICGVYQPDSGSITLNAPLTPLLELGLGWNPELHAVDNILLLATVMGMSLAKARDAVQEVLEFAELERFANMPLKHFSSGMASRLAYSVAFRAVKDVLLIDEIFAVGDAAFKRKCEDRYHELLEKGHSAILVGHQVDQISRFCDRAVLLKEGQIVAEGSGAEIATAYLEDAHGRPER